MDITTKSKDQSSSWVLIKFLNREDLGILNPGNDFESLLLHFAMKCLERHDSVCPLICTKTRSYPSTFDIKFDVVIIVPGGSEGTVGA